ncbi:MAG TPA: NAD(P)-binding protein [Cellvibrio sp.]|nr:NAD(P)-binding protein [Cellvibrio sp.]
MEQHVPKRAIVIGAGLAGLVSALSLQKAGLVVTLIDQRAQAGGLCGTFTLDNREFVIACNDFGKGLVKLLNELGVKFPFNHKKSSVFYRGEWFNAAPDLKMLWQLRHEWRNVFSLLGGIIAQQLPHRAPQSMERFANQLTSAGAVNDLSKLIAYFMGVSPRDIQTSFFGLDGKHKYGYTNMACPAGGPQAMVNAIVDVFLQQGGKLLLNTRYIQHSKQGEHFYTEVSGDELKILEADYIVDTREQQSLYPADSKRGLPLSMLCLAIKSDFPYPENTHTLTYLEPDISRWFGQLDQGIQPERFGFHVFKSDLATNADSTYTLNLYFYLPRGVNQLEAGERTIYSKYLLDRLEKLLPGIKDHLVYNRMLTPDDFVALHGLSSRVMPFICLREKPSNISSEPGLFYAGHSVYPPGEHAGAAALSGALVAQQIIAEKTPLITDTSHGEHHENAHQQA